MGPCNEHSLDGTIRLVKPPTRDSSRPVCLEEVLPVPLERGNLRQDRDFMAFRVDFRGFPSNWNDARSSRGDVPRRSRGIPHRGGVTTIDVHDSYTGGGSVPPRRGDVPPPSDRFGTGEWPARVGRGARREGNGARGLFRISRRGARGAPLPLRTARGRGNEARKAGNAGRKDFVRPSPLRKEKGRRRRASTPATSGGPPPGSLTIDLQRGRAAGAPPSRSFLQIRFIGV